MTGARDKPIPRAIEAIPDKFFAFEHHGRPLLSRRQFLARLAHNGAFAGVFIGVSLFLGVAGYHWLGNLEWIDALVNASMILGGMGPVDPITSVGGKLFASAYALYSGLALLTSASVLLAPVLHRFLHHFHLEDSASKES